MNIDIRMAGATGVLACLAGALLASCVTAPAPAPTPAPTVAHRTRVMPGLRLTILQPGHSATPDHVRYSIPWPRDEQGQPLTGTATMLLHVDVLGQVDSATVEKSSGYNELDSAALNAVRQWHLEPAHEGGVPVESTLRIPIVMNPNDPMAGIGESVPFHPSTAGAGASAAPASDPADLLGPPPGVTSTMVSRRVTKDDHDPEADYINAVGHAIEAHWPQPPSVVKAWCTVQITEIPGGEVVGVEVSSSCPYDATRRKALEDAIWKASPLPYKGYESVWHRHIEFSFGA